MIKIENVDTYGWETAIRGMRNPMNSWDKSDSNLIDDLIIGENDLKLMKNLVKSGNDHSKFMRMITITMDITAPLYWWKEFDTYKVGTVANSCSTMHKIHEKEFTLDDFSHEHLFDGIVENSGTKVKNPLCENVTIIANPRYVVYLEGLKETICLLNDARDLYLRTNDKVYWWQMIQLLPSSYNQKRTVQLNYAVAQNMYHARKEHKLNEWRNFCNILEMLPYSELITD